MAEIVSKREFTFLKNKIDIEFMYIAQYNKDKTFFNNLDYDTAEGETDDAIEILNKHLNEYLNDNYVDYTKMAIAIFKVAPNLDNIKIYDKYGSFKIYRKELEK